MCVGAKTVARCGWCSQMCPCPAVDREGVGPCLVWVDISVGLYVGLSVHYTSHSCELPSSRYLWMFSCRSVRQTSCTNKTCSVTLTFEFWGRNAEVRNCSECSSWWLPAAVSPRLLGFRLWVCPRNIYSISMKWRHHGLDIRWRDHVFGILSDVIRDSIYGDGIMSCISKWPDHDVQYTSRGNVIA